MRRDLPSGNGVLGFHPSPLRRRATVGRKRGGILWYNAARPLRLHAGLAGHGELSAVVVARRFEIPKRLVERWHYALIAWHPVCREGNRDGVEACFSYWPTRDAAHAASRLLARGVPFTVVDADPPRAPRPSYTDSHRYDQMIIRMRREAANGEEIRERHAAAALARYHRLRNPE